MVALSPPSSFSSDRSVAVLVLQLVFVCALVVLYVPFALSLFVPHLFLFCCLGKASLRDFGISWVYSL